MPIFVDASDLTRLDAKLADAIDWSKEIRREMLTDVGEQLLAQVRQKIGGTGKVQRWQHTHLGTGGGYVAVHPVERETDEYGWAVGAVTNAIESGHRFPTIRKAERYRPRIQGGKAKVAGKAMYRTTNPEQAAQTTAAELESRLARLLEE